MLFTMPKSQVVTGKKISTHFKKMRHFVKNAALVKKIPFKEIFNIRESESIHIATQGAINAFTFIVGLAECRASIVDIAIYRISISCINSLVSMIENGQISELNILVNDNIERLKPEVWQRLVEESKAKSGFNLWAQNNHAKIIIVENCAGCFVVEGSGNLSDNARIEQYCIVKSRELAEFHRAWIRKTDSQKSRKAAICDT